jgi:hypothetical protein
MGLHLFDNLFRYFIGYVDLYLLRLLLESKKFLLVKSGKSEGTLLISPFHWGN